VSTVTTETVTLRAGDLEAQFAPGVGMVGTSLRHRGEELLAQRGGLAAYAERGSTFGIPLLHPWANRLGGFAYAVGDTRVELQGNPLLRIEEHGLPIHGFLAASPLWRVVDNGPARLSAELAYGAEELLAGFPFPHTLRIDAELGAGALTVRTTVTPLGPRPVPIAFGFHPYLRLPGVARAAWELDLPVGRRLVLDADQLPTGEEEPVEPIRGPLGERMFDDAYVGHPERARFALSGGGRELAVVFGDGYPCAQVFAPPGKDLICFEPMTAPADALRSGAGLRLAREPFTATFAVEVGAG